MRAGSVALAVAALIPSAVAAQPAPRPVSQAPTLPAPPSEPAKPVFTLAAEQGFFDDPLAIEPGGRRVAFLQTDAASFVRLHVVDLQTRSSQGFDVGSPSPLFEQLHFASGGDGFVIVTRDALSGLRSAQFFDADGKPRGMAGPATEFALTSLGSERIMVGFNRKTEGKGQISYVVTAYRLDRPVKIGKSRGYRVSREGMMKEPQLKVIAWFDGWSKVHAQKPGQYDKQKDFRQPDKAAVFDLLQGKIVSESEIGDVYGWVFANQLRGQRANRTVFALQSDDERTLDLVEGAGVRSALPLAIPYRLYDSRSLREQEGPEPGVFYFSLTVDPLNPDALARQKRDRPFLDIYSTTLPGAGQTAMRTRLSADDRPVGWVAGHGRIAVLRKHKGFQRGGRDLEVYDLN